MKIETISNTPQQVFASQSEISRQVTNHSQKPINKMALSEKVALTVAGTLAVMLVIGAYKYSKLQGALNDPVIAELIRLGESKKGEMAQRAANLDQSIATERYVFTVLAPSLFIGVPLALLIVNKTLYACKRFFR